MSEVKLTGRQQDFLNVINRLYKTLNRPVHYSEVAKQLGINKWTAYDVMKQLNELGALEAIYIVKNDNMPGRSSIGFVPINSCESDNMSNADRWKMIEEFLLLRIKEAKSENKKEVLKDIAEEISKQEDSVLLGAYTIALLVLEMDGELGKKEIVESIKEIYQMKIKGELKLSMLLGLLLGQAMKHGKSSAILQNVIQYINKLQHDMPNIPAEQQNQLITFAINTIS